LRKVDDVLEPRRTTARAGGVAIVSPAKYSNQRRDDDPRAMTNECRPACGACCIAPSISSPIPGMPDGKPAGVRCVQLDADQRCLLFGKPERPAVCSGLRPSLEMCGERTEHAMRYLRVLEIKTKPGS
jgi:uncharacterized protein